MNFSKFQINLLIVIAGAFLFLPFLGNVHLFDWDEINFAECAREMIVSGDYAMVQINYEAFWEKPPVFIWMQVLSMKIFGINEFAARFPNAVCGIFTLLLLFNIGSKIFDQKFALLWTLCYAGSLLPHFYFKSGIIDPWFNFFIFLGVLNFIAHHQQYALEKNYSGYKNITLSAFFIGLGILTKGPVAFLIFGLCIASYFVIQRLKSIINFKQILVFTLVLAFTGASWFLIEIINGRMDVVMEFINYQVRLFQTKDSGHGGPFFYHFLVLLIGCFPASVFALATFKKNSTESEKENYLKRWMITLLLVVLLLFSIVQTKILHYSSMCYFPLTFLAAFSIYKGVWKKWMGVLTIVIASLLSLAMIGLYFVDLYKERIIASNLIKDPFAVANLSADVEWSGIEIAPGLILLIGTILALRIIYKKQFQKGVLYLFGSSLIATSMAMLLITPRVEQYSQGAAIEFFESKQQEDCYVQTYGYKSYAQYFYTKTEEHIDDNKIYHGIIDKPAYLVAKNVSAENLRKEHPQFTELYQKNGFVFFERKP